MILNIFEARRRVSNETDALHLTLVVESNDSDIGLGVLLLDLLNLPQHLRGIGASKHGKLPHHPVASIIVPW